MTSLVLNLYLGGIHSQLCITGYRPSSVDGDWTGEWCATDFAFCAAPWLDYTRRQEEVFLCREVEELFQAFGCLLRDELTEEQEITLMEPDFTFKLYPKRDLRKDPNVTYCPEGLEILDIAMDWRVGFWNKGFTANYLSLALDRKEIEYFYYYLGVISGRIKENAAEITDMLQKGVLTEEWMNPGTKEAFEELDHGGGTRFNGTTEQLFERLRED